MKSAKQSQRGFSLLEVMIAAGILSTVMLGVAAVNLELKKNIAKSAGVVEVDIFRRNILAMIYDGPAWKQTATRMSALSSCAQQQPTTQQQPLSPFCVQICALRPGYAGCGCGGSAGTTPSSGTCPVGSARKDWLALYDGKGQLFYDARDTNNGITMLGVPCGPNLAPPYNYKYPSAECPLRYDLQWYSTGAGGNPLVAVIGNLKVSAFADSNMNIHRYKIPIVYRPAQ